MLNYLYEISDSGKTIRIVSFDGWGLRTAEVVYRTAGHEAAIDNLKAAYRRIRALRAAVPNEDDRDDAWCEDMTKAMTDYDTVITAIKESCPIREVIK